MSVDFFSETTKSQGVRVFQAADFHVIDGVNIGDPLGHAAELIPDDIYMIRPDAELRRLPLDLSRGLSDLRVAESGGSDNAGNPVHLDCCATFMAPDGSTQDIIILVELAGNSGMVANIYLMPTAPLIPKINYALVSINRENTADRFAELACISFTPGTRITLASGEQRPIEMLAPGNRVLTRDNGAQPIRWIGHRTMRATGAMAPVILKPGVLNNAEELVLSPNQHILIYQRSDQFGAGQAEVMARADNLVNGVDILRASGGFVDYYQLLFDNDEIIFAEGIATQSMTLDRRTRRALPEEMREKMGLGKARRRSGPAAVSLPADILNQSDAAERLRRASMR